MKKLLAILVIISCVSLANASIIGYNCADDGDGAIVMNKPAFSYNSQADEYAISMNGAQYWWPAHVLGDFTTDTEVDPTVWLMETVDNDTTMAWTDYHFTITMNKSFTLSNASGPADWSSVITNPTQVGSQWIGYIDLYAGTPVQIGQSADFAFKMAFVGSVSYCVEQVPTPEPATIGLLTLGALALRRKK